MSLAPGGPRHRAGAVHEEISDVVDYLCKLLTSKLVASLTGVKDSSQVRKWARRELSPTQPARTRLNFAFDTLRTLEDALGRRTAESWAMTVDPRLNFDTPIKAIREDRFRETAAAATALREEAFDG